MKLFLNHIMAGANLTEGGRKAIAEKYKGKATHIRLENSGFLELYADFDYNRENELEVVSKGLLDVGRSIKAEVQKSSDKEPLGFGNWAVFHITSIGESIESILPDVEKRIASQVDPLGRVRTKTSMLSEEHLVIEVEREL